MLPVVACSPSYQVSQCGQLLPPHCVQPLSSSRHRQPTPCNDRNTVQVCLYVCTAIPAKRVIQFKRKSDIILYKIRKIFLIFVLSYVFFSQYIDSYYASAGSLLQDYKHLLFLGLAVRSYSLTLVDV